MYTEADRQRDEAIEALKGTKKKLFSVIHGETWGYEDYSEEYKQKLEKAVRKINKVIVLLGG